MKVLRVIVGCEFSGIVREAFRRLGHDAWSCDLLPTEIPGPHIQGDIGDVLGDGWDLGIFHPPCTFMANSGVRWLVRGGQKINPSRWSALQNAVWFFLDLWNLAIPHIAVENPVMHSHARDLGIPQPTQTIQPWQFGQPFTKRTCLWLKNLPPLVPTKVITEGIVGECHRQPPSPDRWKNRSRTYPGIAEAMADQWSKALCGTSSP